VSQPATATEEPVVVKRPRGRPRKHPRPEEVAAQATTTAPAQQPELNLGLETVQKRGRGRPRKHPVAAAVPQGAAPSAAKDAREGAGMSPTAAKTAELLTRANWGEKEWSRHVSVYSQPDQSSPKKFSTVIQLERKEWDKSGFKPDDRLKIERNEDDEVVITRATSGGVKAKKVGDTTVVIQAKTLGNLNLKQVKLAADEDTMVLRGSEV
jgi:hypothetical protein